MYPKPSIRSWIRRTVNLQVEPAHDNAADHALAVNRFGERSDEGEPCDHGVPKKYHLALTMPAAIK
jgi:hypothetical protein